MFYQLHRLHWTSFHQPRYHSKWLYTACYTGFGWYALTNCRPMFIGHRIRCEQTVSYAVSVVYRALFSSSVFELQQSEWRRWDFVQQTRSGWRDTTTTTACKIWKLTVFLYLSPCFNERRTIYVVSYIEPASTCDLKTRHSLVQPLYNLAHRTEPARCSPCPSGWAWRHAVIRSLQCRHEGEKIMRAVYE